MNKTLSNKERIVFRFLKFFLGIGLFIWIILKLSAPEFWTSLLKFKVRDFLIIWALTLLLNLVASYRWYLILKYMNIQDFTFRYIIKLTLLARFSGQAFSQIIGDFGTKSLYLGTRTSIKKAATSIIWDKLFEILLLFSLLIILIVQYFYPPILKLALLILPILIIMIVIGSTLFNYFAGFMAIHNIKWIPDLTISLSNTKKVALALLSLIKYLIVVARYLCILSLVGIDLGFINVFLGTTIAQIGNLIGITPGGLGFVEAGWLGVLHYHAAAADKIALFLFSQRIAILVSVIINFIGVSVIFRFIDRQNASVNSLLYKRKVKGFK